jgi:dTMP kinase
MKIKLPIFILFEGIDGSGKTTLSKLLFQYFSSNGIPAVLDHEPTDSQWGNRLRIRLQQNIAEADELLELFIKDREDDVNRIIQPSLNSGKAVILDRYYYSNAAYQGAMGISPVSIIQENTKRNFPKPDRTYFIDISPELAIERINSRNNQTEIFEKAEFLKKVREIYLNFADESFIIIDGSKTTKIIMDFILDDITQNFGCL